MLGAVIQGSLSFRVGKSPYVTVVKLEEAMGDGRGSNITKAKVRFQVVTLGICCIAHLLVLQFSYLKGLIPTGLL